MNNQLINVHYADLNLGNKIKNIYLIPTDIPSKIGYHTDIVKEGRLDYALNFGFPLFDKNNNYQHNPISIYITNDEEIKEGVNQWYLDKFLNKPRNSSGSQYGEKQDVIILTTDPTLIKDGVQSIDDEFLEWFVKNPSCEEVKITILNKGYNKVEDYPYQECYKIIIPKEEPKQETTLEEAAENYAKDIGNKDGTAQFDFIRGARWQQERMYSEEDLREAFKQSRQVFIYQKDMQPLFENFEQWFEEFKKKQQ
jgi:hypothetical protein